MYNLLFNHQNFRFDNELLFLYMVFQFNIGDVHVFMCVCVKITMIKGKNYFWHQKKINKSYEQFNAAIHAKITASN